MAIEIERKFLVSGPFKPFATKKTYYRQGYISGNRGCTVRIRIAGDKGYITIKGPGSASGMSRFEWEKEIKIDEAKDLLQFCKSGIIEKIRYIIPSGKHFYEVDEFLGDNDGLIVAEIELESEDESFIKPPWLGKEVTGIKKYHNSSLSVNPYTHWQIESKD